MSADDRFTLDAQIERIDVFSTNTDDPLRYGILDAEVATHDDTTPKNNEEPEPPRNAPDRGTSPEEGYFAGPTDFFEALQWHHAQFNGAPCRSVNSTDDTKTDFIDFEPGQGESVNPAKLICNTCIKQDLCLQFALEHHDELRIWGGASGRERKAITKEYKQAIEDGSIDPRITGIAYFAVQNRDTLVLPGNPKLKRTSYKPPVDPEPEIQEANCIGQHSKIFETVDSTPVKELTKEQIALAIIACELCAFFEKCQDDPVTLPEDMLPTVVGGEIRGRVLGRSAPNQKYIDSLIPDKMWEQWVQIKVKHHPPKRKNAA